MSQNESTRLEGKAAVITGGTTGIGRATARLLAAQGAKVLIFGRHQKELDQALDEIRTAGRGVTDIHGLTADQSKPQDVQRVFEEADRRLGGVDILVNNAAISGGGGLTEKSPEDMRYILETNLFGYMACAREAITRMKRRGGGHLVNIGSMSADLREPEGEIYVGTKAGIHAFSESLRKTANKDNIRVTLIEPGAVATPMQEKSPEEEREKIEKMEMILPDDIARCVLYCLTQPQRVDVVS